MGRVRAIVPIVCHTQPSKENRMKTLRSFVSLATASLLAASAYAADLTVNQGQTITASNGDSYDAVVVNGNLTIPQNASVTAASLTVADGAVDATVTLEPGSSLTVAGEAHLGYDGGQAHVNVRSGAHLTVNSDFYMTYGHRSAPASGAPVTKAFLTVSNATVTIKGNYGLCLEQGANWPSSTGNTTDTDFVRLENNAVLECTEIYKGCKGDGKSRSSRIIFDGGKILFKQLASSTRWQAIVYSYNAKMSYIHFESVNNKPIHLAMGSGQHNAWFAFGGSTGHRASFDGAGGVILEGRPEDNKTPEWVVDRIDTSNPNVQLLNGLGPIRLVGMPLVNKSGVNFFADQSATKPQALIAEPGTYFDMYGNNAEFKSVTGCVKNTGGNACVLTVGVDDSDSQIPDTLPSGVSVVKKGSGNLALFASDAAAVTAQGGTLTLQSRSVIGYPFYRVKFDRTGMDDDSSINNAMRVREFAFFANGQNVTRPYAKAYYDMSGTSWITSPERMFDNDFETVYEDYRMHKAIDNSDRDLVQVSLEYESCRVIDSYCWAPYYSTEFQYRLAPTAWRVFGGFSSTPDVLLDQVENFTVTSDLVSNSWLTTNFVCRYANPATTVSSLTLASGATVSVDGADVTATAVTAASAVPVTLAHGGTLTLPAATEIASLSVDVDAGGGALANFRPASHGALYLTGNVARPRKCVLPVEVGSLLGGNLPSWDVYVDGALVDQTEVIVNAGGCLETRYTGATVLYMR